MNNCEIHDLTTKEILADGLFFDDLPELFQAYTEFYPDHEIVACERDEEDILYPVYANKKLSRRVEFQTQWLMLVSENLCNLF